MKSGIHSADSLKEIRREMKTSMRALEGFAKKKCPPPVIYLLTLNTHVTKLLECTEKFHAFPDGFLFYFHAFDIFLIAFLKSKPTIAQITIALKYIEVLIETRRVEGKLDASVIAISNYVHKISSTQLMQENGDAKLNAISVFNDLSALTQAINKITLHKKHFSTTAVKNSLASIANTISLAKQHLPLTEILPPLISDSDNDSDSDSDKQDKPMMRDIPTQMNVTASVLLPSCTVLTTSPYALLSSSSGFFEPKRKTQDHQQKNIPKKPQTKPMHATPTKKKTSKIPSRIWNLAPTQSKITSTKINKPNPSYCSLQMKGGIGMVVIFGCMAYMQLYSTGDSITGIVLAIGASATMLGLAWPHIFNPERTTHIARSI